MNEFQESLNDLILEKKQSRLQIAKTLGVSATTLNGFFNLNYYPSIELAVRMADYFDCSLDYLFGISDNRQKEFSFEKDKLLDNFNKNIENILKSENISNAKIMRDLHMGEFTLYRWRQGKFPKTINVIAVAKYLGISIDYLFGHTN